MKFAELPVKETSTTAAHVVYVNPAHVVMVSPAFPWSTKLEAMQPIEGESMVMVSGLTSGEGLGSWSEELRVTLNPAEVVRLLEGRPAPEDEAKAAAEAAEDDRRREKALSNIKSLFGWPHAELGNPNDASTAFIEAVSESQAAYEAGHEAYARAVERGLRSWPRPAWEWNG